LSASCEFPALVLGRSLAVRRGLHFFLRCIGLSVGFFRRSIGFRRLLFARPSRHVFFILSVSFGLEVGASHSFPRHTGGGKSLVKVAESFGIARLFPFPVAKINAFYRSNGPPGWVWIIDARLLVWPVLDRMQVSVRRQTVMGDFLCVAFAPETKVFRCFC